MGRIKLYRSGLESARGYVGTLTANCELDQKKAINAKAVAQSMDFSGRSALIAQLDDIAARLSKQADRMQRLGTMIGTVGDELAKADVAAGTTSQMLWDQIWSGGRSGAGASAGASGAGAALGRTRSLASLFAGIGTDISFLGTISLYREVFAEKTVGEHSGVSFDGKSYFSQRLTYDGTTHFFDKRGSYGGDQGHLRWKKGFNILGERCFEDEAVFAYVRSHQGYEHYTDQQIADLLDAMNEEGCGYIAAVNNIYLEFESRPEEFERLFGFPMYDEKGRENYDYLFLDMYLETDDKYYLNEPNGLEALVNDTLEKYKNHRDVFQSLYGHYPQDGQQAAPLVVQKIIDQYQGADVAKMETDGLSIYGLDNRLQHYMAQKGITMQGQMVEDRMLSTENVQEYIRQGKSVNLTVYDDFTLYNEYGIPVNFSENHWMTITGTTEQGDYIVSSWGKQYYIKPEKLHYQEYAYYITDVITDTAAS